MGNAAKTLRKMKKAASLFKVISFIVLISIIFFVPIDIIYKNKESFFARTYNEQYKHYKNLYYSSQYVKKDNPGIIPDEALESFIAGAFLKGLNPILVVHDQPPLGRYIVSLSILLLDNQNTIVLPLFFLSIFGIFLVGKEVLQNSLVALIPPALLVNEPLFITKLKHIPLLEPIQLPFIIFALYFFILGLNGKKCLMWFMLTSLMLGFVISIRFFTLGLVLFLCMVLVLFYHYRFGRITQIFAFTLPLSLIVLLFSYSVTMQHGYSPVQIFGVQKYIFFYHKSKFILPFSFFDLLLFNRWHTWWGNRVITSDPQWIILWPIAYIGTLFLGAAAILKRISLNIGEQVIVVWIVLYSLFLSVGYTSTRYFLPLTPFLYVMATSFVLRLYKAYIVYRKRK